MQMESFLVILSQAPSLHIIELGCFSSVFVAPLEVEVCNKFFLQFPLGDFRQEDIFRFQRRPDAV